MTPIIKVENIGKQYTLGQKSEPYSTLRESLVRAALKPIDIIRRNGQNTAGSFWALSGVNFEVLPGEVVGIIGRNGAGKSTLLKILSRITEPTTGRVELYGRVGSLLEVGTGFHPELTGRENVYLNGAILGMRREEISKKFDEIVDFAEIEDFLDTPVKRYSSGMYVRLAFAVAAYLEPEILIVDEVLAVGDAEFQKKCLGKMEDVAKTGRTVLFVSHNLGAVSALCSSAIVLDRGKVKYDGPTAEGVALYLQDAGNSELSFDDGVIDHASVRQVGPAIEISVSYNLESPIDFPCLGFSISDPTGNPVCGTNPKIDRLGPLDSARKQGAVKVRFEHPKLLDGSYNLSLWFGDGKQDFYVGRDCLSFDVVGMTTEQHNRPGMNGYCYPECEWELN